MNLIHCDFYRNSCDYYFFFNEIEPMLSHPWILLLEWMKPEDFITGYGQVTEIFIQHKGDCKKRDKNNEILIYLKYTIGEFSNVSFFHHPF